MDWDKLLNFIPDNIRKLLLPFVVCLPMVYAILTLCVDTYADYSTFDRAALAVAATTTAISLFSFMAFCANRDILTGASATIIYCAVQVMVLAVPMAWKHGGSARSVLIVFCISMPIIFVAFRKMR